ncbi:hypothetical protein L6452_08316 [Arctium lappa]|uniref:Uncharacterized protein n=1 Tax=Arctium lappa TaxID=4217 RepID=A0ACB9DHA1_ARCLA|nr:hypothetical protein L6452_08316 [Arctium lappa]
MRCFWYWMVKKQQRREVGCNRVGSSRIDPDWNRLILEQKPWKMMMMVFMFPNCELFSLQRRSEQKAVFSNIKKWLTL